MSGPYRDALKSAARQFIQILLIARQHVRDEIFGFGGVHGVQGGHLLLARGLELPVAAVAFLDALDDGGQPVGGL